MKILVTGASGYIGSVLVPLLLQQRHQVRILTRDASRLRQSWTSTVEIVEGDLRDFSACEQVAAAMDVVVHLAGLAHVGASREEHRQENFLNTQQLARAALKAGVQIFVYQSSSKANFPNRSDYGKFKRASEDFLLGLGGNMQVTGLRPGIVYGAGMRNNLRILLKLLSKPSLPVFARSTNCIGMISIQDCCQAILVALTNRSLAGRVWELNDGVNYTLQDLVIKVRTQLRLKLPWLYCPRFLVWSAFATAGAIPLLRKRGLSLNTYRALYLEQASTSNEFAKASGTQPTTTFYDKLPELIGRKE